MFRIEWYNTLKWKNKKDAREKVIDTRTVKWVGATDRKLWVQSIRTKNSWGQVKGKKENSKWWTEGRARGNQY